jgi:hypothetical protein
MFMKAYWYALAVGPFFLLIVAIFRYFPNSSSRLLDVLVYVSLAWALSVALYAFVITTRWLFIRCPRCGWRFGPSTRCGSCGLPRSAPPPEADSTLRVE